MKEAELMGMKENTAILEKGTVCVDEPEKTFKKILRKKNKRRSLSPRCMMVPPLTSPKGSHNLRP